MEEEGLWYKDDIMEMIIKHPDRVTFQQFSNKRPHFRKIMIDKSPSGFVKCLKCPDFICKYDSKKGSSRLLNHERKDHNVDGDFEDWNEDLYPQPGKDDEPTNSKIKDSFNYPYMVWDHCTLTGKKTESGLEIRSCNYCAKDLGASPAYATIHMKECRCIPEDIKAKFMAGKKRRWIDVNSDEEFMADDDDEVDQQEKVVKILTGLLTKRAGGGDFSKKPLKNYTEADFDRELKELAVKKARLEVKALEDGQKEMEERCKMYKDIRKAVNVWMEKESNSMVITPRVKDMLNEAYEESVVSVTSHSVNGQ